MRFTAIDVETANSKLNSICQLGVAVFENEKLIDQWEQLVDPEDYFDGMNMAIHGIHEEDIVGAPTFQQLQHELKARLNGVVVSHTHFDRTAIRQACEKYEFTPPTCTWLDSARVARRAWEKFSKSGYGLKNVCDEIGYEFQHHNALEDAKAAGAVVIEACRKTGCDIDEWLLRLEKRSRSRSSSKKVDRDANPDGHLFGETILFTGALHFPRAKAADMAAEAGCTVVSGFSKKVTVLCVGDQDVERLAGHNKSSKHRKAEEAIAAGLPVRIIRETDFIAMVSV
ncbi:MAG: exonuclease domain-containing protein [Pseudomonadota bacterium]